MSESRDFAAFSWVCETCDVGTSLAFDTSAEALDNFNRGHGAMKGLHNGRTAQVRIVDTLWNAKRETGTRVHAAAERWASQA